MIQDAAKTSGGGGCLFLASSTTGRNFRIFTEGRWLVCQTAVKVVRVPDAVRGARYAAAHAARGGRQ